MVVILQEDEQWKKACAIAVSEIQSVSVKPIHFFNTGKKDEPMEASKLMLFLFFCSSSSSTK